MGKLLIIGAFTFFIYSSDRFESRLHIHVRNNSKALAKFWLEPEIELFSNSGFNEKEINKIYKLLEMNRLLLISKLNTLYGR